MITKSKCKAYDALRRSVRTYRAKVEAGLPTSFHKVGRSIRNQHSPVVGSLADDEARRIAGNALIDTLIDHHKRTKGSARRHFLVTFCWDAGVLPIEPPHEFELKAMRLKAYKAIKKLGLEGLGVFEVSPLRGAAGSSKFLNHIHLVCWTRDPHFKPKVGAAKLNKQGFFPNSFGAPAVSIQSRKMAAKNFRKKDSEMYDHLFANLEKDQTKASLAWLGYYLFQAPSYVKQIVPNKRKPGKSAMRSNYTSYSPKLALALHGLLNQIPVEQVVFSIGPEGKELAAQWRKDFKTKIKNRLQGPRSRHKPSRNPKLAVRKRNKRLTKALAKKLAQKHDLAF